MMICTAPPRKLAIYIAPTGPKPGRNEPEDIQISVPEASSDQLARLWGPVSPMMQRTKSGS